MKLRWDPCITNRDAEFKAFVGEVFTADRKLLYVAGAGFDPRSAVVLNVIREVAKASINTLLIGETRLPTPAHLVERATKNLALLQGLATSSARIALDIFAHDLAPIGGQQVVQHLREVDLGQFSDVIVDLSALSVGVSFPAVKYLLEACQMREPVVNLHIVVADSPAIDLQIRSVASDRATAIHGFKGGFGLEENRRAVRLWMPQLTQQKATIFRQIVSLVNPDDVVPIIPFPSRQPRTGDQLLDEYHSSFESEWNVDLHNVLYAQERNPLDLYRSILRITDTREIVFRDIGGSMTILSPTGTKILAVGSLLAALERDFPVIYVEASGYETSFGDADTGPGDAEIFHLWLSGDAYEKE
jgi:hypothetical protein